jgi:hypothetical protein
MAGKPAQRRRSVKAAKSVVDDQTEPSGKTISTTARLDPDRHEQLRTLSFHSRRSMHSLLLEGVDLVLKKHGVRA